MLRDDFRVLQTYGEIKQFVEDAALVVLADRDPVSGQEYYDQWARDRARQIAEQAVRHLDAA